VSIDLFRTFSDNEPEKSLGDGGDMVSSRFAETYSVES